jgi:hypothetical protein
VEYNTAERVKEREKEKYVHADTHNDRILPAPTFQKRCTNNNPWRNKQTEQAECIDNQASVGGLTNSVGPGTKSWTGNRAVTPLSRRFGDTAAVRILRRDDRGTVRNVLRETAVVCGLIKRWSADETYWSHRNGDGTLMGQKNTTRRRGGEEERMNGDMASWSNCTAERAES